MLSGKTILENIQADCNIPFRFWNQNPSYSFSLTQRITNEAKEGKNGQYSYYSYPFNNLHQAIRISNDISDELAGDKVDVEHYTTEQFSGKIDENKTIYLVIEFIHWP